VLPPGLSLDEASRGYDAYSLLLTGADQYGVRWPLFAEGLADHTSALFTYTAMPFVALLGLTEAAVRLPAAVAGTLTVIAVYALGRMWFGATAALVAAFAAAVSAWHILPSRTGDERPLLPLLATVALYLCWLARRDLRLIPAAGLALGLGLYGHAFGRVLIPLLAFGFVGLFWRDVRQHWRAWAGAGCLFLLLAIPVAIHSLSGEGLARFRVVVPIEKLEFVGFIEYAVSNYISYFDPRSLYFGVGSSPRTRLGNFGPILTFMLPLVVAGAVRIVSRPSRERLLVLWWLAAGPATSALHNQSPSMDLALGTFPAVMLIAGIGAAAVWNWLAPLPRWTGLLVAMAIGLSALVGTANVWRELYFRYASVSSGHWLDGARTTVATLERLRGETDRVAVSDRLSTPHLLVLFYTRFDPVEYQRRPIHVDWPQVRSRGTVGQYEFGRIERIMARPDAPRILWVTDDDAEKLAPKHLPTLTARQPNGRIRWSVLDLR
jgi:hypothetical protein